MLRLNPKQNEYIKNANKRWNLKIGAVRSGKSYVDIVYVIPARLRAVKDLQGLNAIIGVSKETIERNVLQPMREIYTSEIVGTINSRNIAMVCGVPVYCLGAEKASQVAKIQGASIKYCYGDEIAKWNQSLFTMLQSRLDKPYSKFDGACNPEYPAHWLKTFIDSPKTDTYVQKYTIFDNPALDKDFVDNLCKEYEGTVYYQRYILGEWSLAEGLIYPMYSESIENPPERTPEQYVLSIDYGTMNAFAALLWGKYGDVWYLVQEYYYSGRNEGIQKTDEEYADELEKRFGEYSNEYAKLRVIVDPSATSFITLLKRRKRYRVIPADNDVRNGIIETARALKNGKIKIAESCVNTIREFGGYVWDDKAVSDTPVKVNDHCLTGDTLVMTEDGKKPISELAGKSGKVWSLNIETSEPELKAFFEVRVTQKGVECIEIETEKGRKLKCTPEHLIACIDFEYIQASNTKGLRIPIFSNHKIEIDVVKSIRAIGKEDVYNMEVEDNHNFAVNGGIIVHNCMDSTRYFVKTMKIAVPRPDRNGYLS